MAVCGLRKNDLSSDGKLVFQITAQIVFILRSHADPQIFSQKHAGQHAAANPTGWYFFDGSKKYIHEENPNTLFTIIAIAEDGAADANHCRAGGYGVEIIGRHAHGECVE